MRRIALLADGWKRLVTYEWIMGIKEYIKTLDEEYEISHFNCMGNWSDDPVYNTGEYNIYNLPDLTMFDGIILDVNNVREPKQLDRLIRLVVKSGVPAISVGCWLKDFYYVGVDNAGAITSIMEHLWSVHDCKSFYFVAGPRENDENNRRVNAYLSAIDRWGLNIKDNPVYYGNFEMSCGIEFFREFVASKKSMPDVFVCANDNIAAGLIEEASRLGYRVPDDFRVTGFDNLDKAICFSPQITTVAHKRNEIGGICIKLLNDIWDGKADNRDVYLKPEIFYSESCGCKLAQEIDFRRYMRNSIIAAENKRYFEERLIGLETRLGLELDPVKMVRMAGDFFEEMDCDGISIVLDERLWMQNDLNEFPSDGYDMDHLIVAYDNNLSYGAAIKYTDFILKSKGDKKDNVFMYTPLHFQDKTIGFSILKNGNFLFDNPYFYDVQNLVNNMLWEKYQKKLLIDANNKLDELYHRDVLTGLYNRYAYYEMIDPMLERCNKQQKPCLIAFFDCDNFKDINDELGHDAGDNILKRIGNILMEYCECDGYAYRFGGDEFVLVKVCADEAVADMLRESISERFAREGISISMGAVISDYQRNISLDEYVNMADKKMYDNKRMRKG